jgi:PST family polysaccharide transporter
MASSIVAIATLVAEGGLALATTSHASISVLEEGALAAQALRAGVVYYFLCVLVGLAVSFKSGLANVLPFTIMLGVPIPLAGFAAVCLGRLQRIGVYGTVTKYQLLGGFAGISAGFAVYLSGYDMLTLIIQGVVTGGTFYGLLILSPAARLRPRGNRDIARNFRHSLNYALGSNFVGTVGRRADDIIIGLFLGPAALGQYALGYRVMTIGTEVLLHPGERVSMVHVGRAAEDSRSRALTVLASNQRRIASIAVPAFAAGGIVAFLLIPRVFGETWSESAKCALLLSFAGAAQATYNLTYAGLFKVASPRVAFRYQVFLIATLLTPTFAGMVCGVVGAASGFLLGSLLGLGIAEWSLRRVKSAPRHRLKRTRRSNQKFRRSFNVQ